MQRRPREQPETESVATTLADSDEAVYNLLESLLQEVDEFDTQPSVKAEVQRRVEQEKVEVAVVEPVVEQVKVLPTVPIEQAIVAETDTYSEQPLPGWAKGSISCLICEVEGIEIAVPMVILRGIAVWDMKTLPMPVQPEWHLGVVDYRGNKITVLDTARLIMPDKVRQTADERRRDHAGHFIVINDTMALSCDAIKQTIKLEQDEIRWRPKRPTRPWAVGTLIDRLCILLDTQALLEEIQDV